MKIDFENIEQRCVDAIGSIEYTKLTDKVNKAKKDISSR